MKPNNRDSLRIASVVDSIEATIQVFEKECECRPLGDQNA